jgi:hypothetical protein
MRRTRCCVLRDPMNARHWVVQLFIAVDQLLNILVTPLSGSAWADETLSSRAWRMYARGKPWGRIWKPVIDALFFWQSIPEGVDGHCHYAYLRERDMYGHPPEMRHGAEE